MKVEREEGAAKWNRRPSGGRVHVYFFDLLIINHRVFFLAYIHVVVMLNRVYRSFL